MEVLMLKAKAQLHRVLPATAAPRGTQSGGKGGGGGGAARGEGATEETPVMATASPNTTIDLYLDYWLNSTWNDSRIEYNSTDLELAINSTDIPHTYWFCAKWASAQQDLFQTANLCFAFAFLIPKSFKQSILIMRALAVAGFGLLAAWAGAEVCAPDVLAWNLFLVTVNSIHTVCLIIRFLPPALSLELTELYGKVFKPLRVSKKHFQELTREARVVRLEAGEAYAVEEVTPADERLAILLRGKLRVTCDGTHLHFIQPHQFVDSPEWEANTETSDDVFQVSIVAEESCTCLCWPRMRLERVLRHRPLLKVVVDCLIGKDITYKLYSVSETSGALHVAASAGAGADGGGGMARSASVDAVHEGARGRLRSLAWRRRAGYRQVDQQEARSNWRPMVARHFPRQSPFPARPPAPLAAPPPLPPAHHRLVTQASSASLQPPLARKKSFTRKATSFRKAREVKFAEPDSPDESSDGAL